MQGKVFNIQKFSIHDGPGIRTTVFLKGCPLRCAWCANPESQLLKTQILYDASKCLHCRQCEKTCEVQVIRIDETLDPQGHVIIDHERCTGCGKCVAVCPGRALSVEGEDKELQEVLELCLQDEVFYEESRGGVTISGGEGMIQPAFARALVRELKKRNIHTAIETTGCVSPEIFHSLAPEFDLLLFDVKQADTARHKEGTGISNEQIVENLKWAVSQGLNILPRIPVIPGFNATLEDAARLAALIKEAGLNQVQLLPFHQMGERKYEFLNRSYPYKKEKALHPEDLKDYQQVFLDQGLNCFF